jgi:hypothetical protein
MVALFVSSTIIMDKQKKESELLVFAECAKDARTQMLMRKAEMEKGGPAAGAESGFPNCVRAGNEKLLVEELIKLRQIYD